MKPRDFIEILRNRIVEIAYNPYQGLKQIPFKIDLAVCRTVEIAYNPYQGLKHHSSLTLSGAIGVEIAYNPYQGLKLLSSEDFRGDLELLK